MTDHQERPVPDQRHSGPSVELSPPPKLDTLHERSPRDSASAPTGNARGPGYWLTLVVFAVLVATALAVFVLLPDWVEKRSTEAEARAPASPQQSTTQKELASAESAGVAKQPERSSTPSSDAAEPAISPSLDPASPAPALSPTLGPAQGPVPTPAPEPPQRSPPTGERASPPATTAVTADPVFASLMAEGLASLERDDLEAARLAFEKASALSPGSVEAAGGIARVEAAEQLVALAGHQDRAEAFETQERWGEAVAEYASALTLDPTIRFALSGHERSEYRHRLSRQLDAYVGRPERLSSDSVLASARGLLAEAEEVEADELETAAPVLRRQIAQLRHLVDIAATPIRVVLLSDEVTEVLVYGVGQLGTFDRKELDLRPGTYTVVGTRDGYRDVRRQLVVEPGAAPSLTVRCEERI